MFPALLLAATLIVVGLLIVVLFRMGARMDALRAELERMRVVQRDMSSDVRARLDEGARTWESVEAEVRPRLELLEPSVADLSAALEENLPALSDARGRLEAVESRVAEAVGGFAETEARVVRALETGSEEGEERFERVEAAVRTLRNAADERLADLTVRVSTLESDAVTAEPEEDAALEAVGAIADAAPSPRGNRKAGGSSRRGSGGSSRRGSGGSSRRGSGGSSRRGGGRWMLLMLVMLVVAAGVAVALDQWG